MNSQVLEKLKKIKPWNFMWIAVFCSEVLAISLMSMLSYAFYSSVVFDIVIMGAITACIVPLLVAPVLIYSLNDAAEKSKLNKLLQSEVTERRLSEEKLRQSQDDWENTFHAISDIITVHDKDYNIIKANRAAQDILNLPELEINQPVKCFRQYHGTDNPPRGCPSCDCIKTGKASTVEVFEQHLNRFLEIRAIPRINAGNTIEGLIHVVRDISERKKIDEDRNKFMTLLSKGKSEWEKTFDAVSDFIVLIDGDFNIRRCNRGFSRYAGASPHELINKKYYEYLKLSNSDDQHYLNEQIKKKESIENIEIHTEDDNWFYVSLHYLEDSEWTDHRTLMAVTNITALKNTQNRLNQSREDLERQVQELEKFYDMAVSREMKMIELKKEIASLENRLHEYEGKDSNVAPH